MEVCFKANDTPELLLNHHPGITMVKLGVRKVPRHILLTL
jgi:hypothetical protein